ncbi:MAG: hypothetical protein F7C35_07540 [Desulfurococcales archaeon]|nr:hypothetical protein [Desulfurococcales archaeon]
MAAVLLGLGAYYRSPVVVLLGVLVLAWGIQLYRSARGASSDRYAAVNLGFMVRVEGDTLRFKEPLTLTPCILEVVMKKPWWRRARRVNIDPELLMEGWGATKLTPVGGPRTILTLTPEDFKHAKQSVLTGFYAMVKGVFKSLARVDRTMWIRLPAYCITDPRFPNSQLYIALLTPKTTS